MGEHTAPVADRAAPNPSNNFMRVPLAQQTMFHRTAIINRTANRGASLSELLFVPCPTDKDWRHVRQGQSGRISRWELPLPDFTRRESLTAIAASAAISVLPGAEVSSFRATAGECVAAAQRRRRPFAEPLALRDDREAKVARGPKYNPRGFGDAVVLGGNVPMDVLTKNIDDYIARTKA